MYWSMWGSVKCEGGDEGTKERSRRESRERKERTYAHLLRSDENELSPVGGFGGFDHHLHGDAAVHGVLRDRRRC